jgi:hypothetical protein
VLGWDAVAEREVGEERAGQHLERAGMIQPGPALSSAIHHERARGAAVARQEAQEVDLLADLRHQRKHHRGGGAEQQQIEMAAGVAMLAGEFAIP